MSAAPFRDHPRYAIQAACGSAGRLATGQPHRRATRARRHDLMRSGVVRPQRASTHLKRPPLGSWRTNDHTTRAPVRATASPAVVSKRACRIGSAVTIRNRRGARRPPERQQQIDRGAYIQREHADQRFAVQREVIALWKSPKSNSGQRTAALAHRPRLPHPRGDPGTTKTGRQSAASPPGGGLPGRAQQSRRLAGREPAEVKHSENRYDGPLS